MGLVLLAAYSLALVALLGGGGDDDDPAPVQQTGSAPAERQAARPATPLERKVLSIVRGVDVRADERGDVARFRQPMNISVRCSEDGRECAIRYSIGLAGRGRVLQDQRPIWTGLFGKTDVLRATVDVFRDKAAAGVPAKEDEETASGAPILTTTCDRSKHPDADWGERSAVRLLLSLCESHYDARGVRRSQETVAPDDPAAAGLGATEGS